MPRYGKKIYTLIDFGSDKIGVMYGTADEAGRPEVLSFAQKNSEGIVQKGEIMDYNRLIRALSTVLKEADKLLTSSGERGKVVYLLNGMHVTAQEGIGSVNIAGAGEKITPEQCDEAVNRAITQPSSPERRNFGIYDSYFVIDGHIRVKNPIGEMADRLDAHVHLLSTDVKRLDRIDAVLREVGFEQGGEPMYSAIAPVYGALTVDERNQGALVIDMGAETTSYAAVADDGVLTSGMIPVGTSHAANDLHAGLDLPFDFCRTFLRDHQLVKLRGGGVNFLEYTDTPTGKRRHIPLDSFEKICNARLHETFSLIRSAMEEHELFPLIGSGCVLTGGGATLDPALNILRDVMGMHVRLGEPEKLSGPMNGFTSAPPCYAALWGMLKAAAAESDSSDRPSISDALAGIFDRVMKQLNNTRKAWRI